MTTGVMPDTDLLPAGLPFLDSPAPIAAPRVNLLPPEIAEQRAIHRLAAVLAMAVLGCVVLVGAGSLYAGHGQSAARADLAAAKTSEAGLQQQQAALAPAQARQTQIQTAQKSLASAMGNEVLWSRYLDDLRLHKPDGVRFSQVALTPVGAAASSSGTAAPSSGSSSSASAATAAPGAIATVSITGKADGKPSVAALLDQLAQIPGFTAVTLTSATGDSTTHVTSYTITASITADALSHRYTDGVH